MNHRTIIATFAVVSFLQSQQGEFTVEEIRNLSTEFHPDNDSDDVLAVCSTLAGLGKIRAIQISGYVAFSGTLIA